MDLTPDLLLEAKFAPARRGYDMNEVDDFLERCAEGLDVLLARLRAEFERAERAEAALAELQAGGTPVLGAVEDAADPAGAPEPFAVEPAGAAEPDPARLEEPMRILLAAERTAETAIAEARAEAERIRAEAESVASTTRSEAEVLLARAQSDAEAEARRAGEEARRAIEAEVLSLREDREVLSADVANLRRWLDDQRARVRATAAELARLVDDPAALGDVEAPTVSAIDDEPDEIVDARGDDGAGTAGSDPGAGEPTQAVPRFDDVVDGDIDGPSLFDDERASTAAGGIELR